MNQTEQVLHTTRFSEYDINLFKSGKHFKLYEKLGSHLMKVDGKTGVYFAVWAPNAKKVSVIGNFNSWEKSTHTLYARWDHSGIWEGFIPDLENGTLYKYAIETTKNQLLEKADPFARFAEQPPNQASIVWEDDYKWKDKKWMADRKKKQGHAQPFSCYEVHLGSWKKKINEWNQSLSYIEMADQLVAYVKELNFTHVEMMPVMEHPYFPSWGYQITGYFAPSSLFGNPAEFKYLVDAFHEAGIGVLLDWVPSHFPEDAHGLAYFDGTHLFEHEDPRKGFHPDWKSAIFNYGRNEVRAFLISNAIFWMEQYHADGLRVDAVASMLYLDYSREDGEWIPNQYGGNENLEAIAFLREFNEQVYAQFPDAVTIAEESTSFAGVSKPTYVGGLGFGQKWMMGWMHDTLDYFGKETIYRSYHQNDITFSLVYAFTENFMLPLSHDEVVHGKGSLINRMPGDEWQKFANLRCLFSYMYMHPGTKLLFMGSEFGQTTEWNIETGLEWYLTEFKFHKGIQTLIKDLNALYKENTELYEKQFDHDGFEWIDYSDHKNSVLSFVRKDHAGNELLVVCNFLPTLINDYKIGVASKSKWKEIFNSDAEKYGGSNQLNTEALSPTKEEWHGRPYYIEVKTAPLSIMVFGSTAKKKTKVKVKKLAKPSKK